MSAIFKREFRSYFKNMTGYAFVAALLIVISMSAVLTCLFGQTAAFETALSSSLIYESLMIFIPILTMKSFAEDRRLRTDKLLYSLPISLPSVVMGKFLALVTVFSLPMLLIATYPMIFRVFGPINIVGSYLTLFGMLCLGIALISICMFISTFSDNQIIVAVMSFGALLFIYLADGFARMIPADAWVSLVGLIIIAALSGVLLYFMTKKYFISIAIPSLGSVALLIVFFIKSSLFEGLIKKLLTSAALFTKFTELTAGIFDLRTIFYFLSITVFFVFLTVQSLEKRRIS